MVLQTFSIICLQALQTKFGRGLEGAPVPLLYHCSGLPYILREGSTVAAAMSGDAPSSGEMSIAVVFTKIQLLPTPDIQARMPDATKGAPTRAPQAFQVCLSLHTPPAPPRELRSPATCPILSAGRCEVGHSWFTRSAVHVLAMHGNLTSYGPP